MGPFFKTSALCLIALCGLQQEAQATLTFTVQPAGDDLYTTINLARRGNLSIKINDVVKDDSMIGALQALLKTPAQSIGSGTECAQLTINDNIDKTTFHVKYSKAAGPNYRELVQKALTDGLEQLQSYPSTWNTLWGTTEGSNLANLLWSASNKVGCSLAICQKDSVDSDTAFVFCQFNPLPEKNAAPFTNDYYAALKERTTQLKDMNEEDLKASAGSSVIAVPSVLLASLLAIMATVAA